MATASAGYEWPRSSPLQQSPDTTSPIYPDRPIRPLPKRPLRARLSPEQAESIIFPPVPQTSTTLFSFPYSQADDISSIETPKPAHNNEDHIGLGGDNSDLDSEADEERLRGPISQSPSLAYSQTHTGVMKGLSHDSNGLSKPASTASSVDGYESFENTNNKKKRKIPNMTGPSGHHTSLSPEMSSVGLSAPIRDGTDDGEGAVGQYYGSGASAMQSSSSGTGISGAGRGRYGRSAIRSSGERRPLVTSTNAINAYASGYSSRSRREFGGSNGNGKAQSKQEGIGIISSAIGKAEADVSQRGNENVSVLDKASRTPPQNSQFTFTCESDSTKVAWPSGAKPYDNRSDSQWSPGSTTAVRGSPYSSRGLRSLATQGTQTSPNANGAQQTSSQTQTANSSTAPQNVGGNLQQGAQQTAPAKIRRRRNLTREFALAARQRRLQQEYTNFHHPPSRDQIWICEFCEYESIFGHPPDALIRDYEIKDRQERKRLAEKRRLLEKARQKGRKGKKSGKSKGANGNGTTQGAAAAMTGQSSGSQQAGGYEQQLDANGIPIQDDIGDEYLDDDYDDAGAVLPTVQTGQKIHSPLATQQHTYRHPPSSAPESSLSPSSTRATMNSP